MRTEQISPRARHGASLLSLRPLALFVDGRDRRLRAGWRIVAYQLLIIGALMLLEDGLTARIRPELSQSAHWVLDAITGIVAFGVSTWLAGRWLDRRPFVDFGFRLSGRWWRLFAFGAALGASLMAIMFLAELALGFIHIVGIGTTVEAGTPLAWALAVMLIQCIGVAFTEELWARGYILRNLLDGFRGTPRWLQAGLAILVSSLIFALPHGGNPNATLASSLVLIIFGMMCAVGVLRTSELGLPLGLHLTWNFFQGNIFGFPVSGWEMRGGTVFQVQQTGPAWFTGGAFGPEGGAAGLAAMLLAIVVIIIWTRKHYAEQASPGGANAPEA